MTRCAERNPLGGVTRIGMHNVIRGHQLRDIHEIFSGSGLPRTRVYHAVILTRQPHPKHRPPA